MDIVQRLRNLSWQIEMAKVQADRREAADEIERLREALKLMVDEKCDYMKINNLGDPEQQHTIKTARAALKGDE